MKITLIGDDEEGKKTFFEKYLGKEIGSPGYFITIGTRFSIKMMSIDDRSVKFQIWFLNEAKRHNEARNVYHVASLGALVFFDLTSPNSFENCAARVKEIWTNSGRGPIPIVLIGNNIDQREDHPDAISDEVAVKYAKKLSEQTKSLGFDIQYLPISMRTGLNVDQVLETLGRIILKNMAQKNLPDRFQAFINKLRKINDS
jgi:small GTP-binding protein